MDVDEIKARKTKLKHDLTQRIEQFMRETGCRPEIGLDYRTVDRIGEPPLYIPVVKVIVVL